jgi:hypothetical protein
VKGKTITWSEKHLIVRSHKLAKATIEALQARLAKAQVALEHFSDQRGSGLAGLRVLTRRKRGVRQYLVDTKAIVTGWYAGKPKRTTNRPTAQALLGAWKGIHLSEVSIGQQLHRHVIPLLEVQKHLLALLDLSPALYEQLSPPPT